MRFILRKYVDADSAKAALALDRKTPVHDCYLKDGEEPRRDDSPKDLIGFAHPEEATFGNEPDPYGKNVNG